MTLIKRLTLLVFLAIASFSGYAQAPNISYASPQVYTLGTTISPLSPTNSGGPLTRSVTLVLPDLDHASGVAIDASGNLYVAEMSDFGNGDIKKIPAGGGTPVVMALGYAVAGIAVDGSGNVFFTDGNLGRVNEILASNGSIIVVASGFNDPSGIAIDASGNIYVSDTDNNAVKKIPTGSNTPVAIGSGFITPGGVAVDAAGNVYVADGSKAIKKIPASGGSPVKVANGSGLLVGLAVDETGNLYISDPYNDLIKELPAGGGSLLEIASDLRGPGGMAIDASGAIYFSEFSDDPDEPVGPGGLSDVQKLSAPGYSISPALPAGLYFEANGGTISGTPNVTSPATDYTVTATNASGSVTTTVNIAVYSSGLANLVPSDGALSPTFATTVSSYTLNESNAVSSVTLTPTVSVATDTVIINGTAVTSGTPSQAINLAIGPNTINIVVKSSTGTVIGNYTVAATRAASNNANLSALNVNNAILSPAFDQGTTSYAASVPYATSSVTIAPAAADTNATVSIDGDIITPGSPLTLVPLNVGSNTINVLVTAQDGATTQTYTISITRSAGNDVSLANLTVSSGTLNPAFTTGTLHYAVSEPYTVSSITVTPTLDDTSATVKVNGTAVAPGAASAGIPLSVGSNTINVMVTGADGATTQTYTITATRAAASTNALIASISTTPVATLVGATGPGYLNFTAGVPNSTSSIQVIPTAKDATATITVNGQSVASGTASQSIPLPVGQTVITTVITAQDGVTTKTIIITVTRAPSNNAGLSNIGLSSGTLSPAFVSTTTSYKATVNDIGSVIFTPTTADPAATLTVNGTAATSGTGVPVTLVNGANTVTTVVTAQDGKTTKTYTTIVTLVPGTNAQIATIATNPTISLVGTTGTGYLNFKSSVPNSISSIQEIVTLKDPLASMTINGTPVTSGVASQSIALPVGQTVITTAITAQDGVTQKTVILTVTRAPSSNAALSNITLSSGTLTPAFVTSTISYKASVTDIGSVTITPTIADPTATLTINGTAATSGTPTSVTLVNGANTITTVVTAQDGTTKKTYTTVVTLIPGTNAQIATIATNPTISLVGTTGTGYLNFKSSVPNSISSIQEIVTLKDPLATMTVNGTPATSGVASQAIPLPVGQIVITTGITAQDGVTQKTVILTITRAPSSNAGLSNIALGSGTLTPAFVTSTTSYKASVTDIGSVTITPTTADPTATLTVNGTAATSGTPVTVTLVNGANTINTVVTAQDGVTTKTYTTVVTLTPGTNAQIATIATTPTVSLVGTTGTGYLNFKASVPNSFSSIQEIVTLKDPLATMTVNGTAATSGSPSQSIDLPVGATTITTVITAQDGVTQKTVIVTITRAAPPSTNAFYQSQISVTKPADQVSLADDGITVHEALSPNGDGINDYLAIDGITGHPENKLTIIDRNGRLVYQTTGYDNSSKIFDGHSNGGKMQLPGTYFYSLDYMVNGESRHKTGYILLKY